MPETETKVNMNLTDWLNRVSDASDYAEVFKILEEFRPLTWTDNERSQMAKHYIRVLDYLPEPEDDDDQGGSVEEAKQGDDGPVWYEKM